VIAFDTVERALRWSESDPAKELAAMRNRAAKSRTFIVEGFGH
jgi:uncharacterized protein (DUF1330 family)